jgi:hypothetical protein
MAYFSQIPFLQSALDFVFTKFQKFSTKKKSHLIQFFVTNFAAILQPNFFSFKGSNSLLLRGKKWTKFLFFQ